jgi:hypothetical protein
LKSGTSTTPAATVSTAGVGNSIASGPGIGSGPMTGCTIIAVVVGVVPLPNIACRSSIVFTFPLETWKQPLTAYAA